MSYTDLYLKFSSMEQAREVMYRITEEPNPRYSPELENSDQPEKLTIEHPRYRDFFVARELDGEVLINVRVTDGLEQTGRLKPYMLPTPATPLARYI